MLGKSAVVFGPMLMGTIVIIFSKMNYSEETSSRISIASVTILFLLGGILLTFVNKPKEVV